MWKYFNVCISRKQGLAFYTEKSLLQFSGLLTFTARKKSLLKKKKFFVKGGIYKKKLK